VDLASPTGLDVHALLHLFVKRRWLVLGTAVIVFSAFALYTLRQPKVFAASTSVIIDSTAPRVLDSQVQEVSDNGAGSYWYTKEYTETQTRIMTSRAVAERVVDKLGLGRDPEFLGVARITDPQARQKAMASVDGAALLLGKLSVAPVKDTRLVAIRVEDSDPKRAALLANEVAEAYIAETLALKLRLSESANRWLEDRLAELEQKTKQSELAIYDFKKDADMLTTSLEDRASMVSQRLNTYNGALTEVRTRIAGLRARVEAIQTLKKGVDTAKDPDWADVLTHNLANPATTSLKGRYLQEKAECSALGERYLAGHPKLAGCLERVAVARQDLLHELDNIVRAAELELREATGKERNLETLLASAKAEAFEDNKRQI
jgi:uncharacterized protein involved in exopolysaccharide biosynthesis